MGLLAAAALTLVISQPALSGPPPDFAVRITYGLCWNESVDTARGVFTRVIRDGLVRRARFSLAKPARDRLYSLIAAANVFDYPTQFTPTLTGMAEPAPQFRVEIQDGGRHHVVVWTDYGSDTIEATRLRAMLVAVRQFFAELPPVKRLPLSQMVCL
jgi:hypothetical protein